MGYLIDTNVLSEIRKGKRANAGVREWFVEANDEDLFVSVLTLQLNIRCDPFLILPSYLRPQELTSNPAFMRQVGQLSECSNSDLPFAVRSRNDG